MRAHGLRHATFLLSCLMTAVVVTSASAGTIWFDETNGGKNYSTFANLVSDYAKFTGSTDGLITFNDLADGTKLSNQYEKEFGVSFLNTANGKNAKLSGIAREGGSTIENLTGYDGSYMPNGDKVYGKFDNDLTCSPFTILFDDPVSSVGAFLGMGIQGNEHRLKISLYDDHGNLLGDKTVNSWLWDKNPSKQNYETFFHVDMDTPLISRVEILNLAHNNYANALVIDNIGWSKEGAGAGGIVPEPATVLLSLVGALSLWSRPRRLR